MAVGSHGAKNDSGADYAASGAQFVEYEEFIEAQLRKTRSHVRGVDIATATMVLLAGTVGYFFVAVLIDHWLVSGGLGFWGRTILLALFLVAASWWTITQILPLLLRRINPLYAAQTIEHSRPTLKNALVNFLLFRSDPNAVHQRVFEQIEQQAATSLVGVEVESTVDRSRLVTIGYVLVALVALGAIYALVSPKSPFKTVSRVFMPWADIAPPTSTVIDEIEPGSSQAFRGQQVTVKARVQGLPDGEQVLLYYTTADRQIVDRAVEMARPTDDYRHVAVLPAGDAALQQSITYRIEAGDAESRDYQIEVVAAPTIVVHAVEYKYPAYTGLLGQRVEHQGDLKAIEGTEVTLEGLANQPIGKASVDFDANGSLDLTMRADGTTARTSFRLGMSEDRKKPEYELYQLIFKNAVGQQNPQPVRHRIEVVADLAPQIQFVQPTREEIEVPLDGSVELELVASDPDFALVDVRIVMRHGDQSLVDEQLLNEPWRGQFVKKLRFSPQDHKLAAGDVVEYYATAVDNKSPGSNRKETSRRRIRILSPTGRDEGNQLAQKDAHGEQGADDDSQSQPGGRGEHPRDEQVQSADQETQANEQGESGSPEDAAARVNREQGSADESLGEQNAEQEKPNDARNQSGDKRGDQNPAGDRQDQADDQNEPQPSGTEQQAGDESGSEKSSDNGSQQGKQSDAKQSGSKQSGDQQERGQPGEQQSGSDQGGAQQGASGSAGRKQGDPSRDQSGSNSSDKGQSGQQQESDSVASDGTNDGDAIERILKHRDQQEPNSGGQTGQKSADKDLRNSKKPAADKQDSGKQQGEQSGDQTGQKSAGNKQQGQQQSGSGQEPGSKSKSNDPAQPQEGSDAAKGQQQGKPQQKGKPEDAKSTSGDKSDQSEQGQPSDANEQASDQQGASDAGQRPGDQSKSQPGQKQRPERTPGEGQQETENPAGEESSGKPQDPSTREGNQGEQGATRDNNTREDGSPQNTDTKGQGAQSKDDPTRAPDQKSQQSSEQRPDAKGGDGQQEKGQSGAGKKSQDNAGSPSPQESNQPREKSQQPGAENSKEKPEEDEQSPSTSKRESDSSGEADGDRSGGGEKGGGQKANQSGTGGAGQNTAADEGAGQSDEAGDGDTSDRAGGDRESKNQTGQQGKQPGQGSETKSGQGKEQPGGELAPSQSGGEPSNDQKSGGEVAGTPGGEQGGANTPKGAGNSAPDHQWQPGVDRAADANLEYTRKATDLALEHLKDQLADGRDDSELLKGLGWTREEADAFVQRWEAMRGQSQASGPKGDAARRELDETLRSLGLRPRGSEIRSGGKVDDRAAGLQESRRTTPPPEYSEAFKAYTQGTSRGGK